MPTIRSTPNLDALRDPWLREAVEAYLSGLEQRGYSASSIGRRVQPLVRFANLALLHGATHLAQLPDLVGTFVDAEVDMHRQRVTSAERRRLYLGELRRPIDQFLRVVVLSEGAAPRTCEPTFWGQAEGFFTALRDERGLTAATIRLYRGHLRAFEGFLDGEGIHDLAMLTPTHIDGFIRVARKRLCAKAMPGVCSALRLLVRWLFRELRVPRDISDSVEAPQAYRLATIPRSITWDEVLAMLAAVDQTTAVGMRDYAMLLLIVFYGLRAREVAALSLDDLDWRQDRLRVPGRKADHSMSYPLSTAVGEAVIRYLRQGRPTTVERRVFLAGLAPSRAINHAIVSARAGYYLSTAHPKQPTCAHPK